MRRVFYTERGKHYLLVGVPYSWIKTAPEGEVVIDPTVSVAASEDVWLENTSNFDGHSAGLLIGKASCCSKKRTIIKFNLAGSGIPSSATVLNAQMKLYYYTAVRVGTTAWVDRWVQAHQILVNWNQSQATRDNRLTGTLWNVQYVGLNDIDAKSAYESTVLFQSGQYPTWKSWDLTTLTERWLEGTAANYGVVLWATNETTDGYDLRFRASEYATTTERPYLQVTYSTSSKTVYFLKDHLGSVRATVDNTGAVVGYDDYDPWGYILANRSLATPWSSVQGTAKNKFTSKEWDDEFGVNWNYFGARYYDPQIGRWMSVDPAFYRWSPERYFKSGLFSISPYVYVRNNPLNRFDPDGQKDVSAMFKAGLKTIGGGLTYAGGWALQLKGVAVTVATAGGFSPVGVGMVLGGEGLKLAGAFSFFTGIADFAFAASVPYGTDAEVLGNLTYEVAKELGLGGTKLEIVGLLEDILTGGKDIGKLAVDGKTTKLVEALIYNTQITEDVRAILEERYQELKEAEETSKDNEKVQDTSDKEEEKREK